MERVTAIKERRGIATERILEEKNRKAFSRRVKRVSSPNKDTTIWMAKPLSWRAKEASSKNGAIEE